MRLPKDYKAFRQTLDKQEQPPDWPVTLRALWYDAKGDWHSSHDLVDQLTEPMAKWIHAYLHRKEGDDWNARYWYRQAGKPFPEMSLDKELKQLVEAVVR